MVDIKRIGKAIGLFLIVLFIGFILMSSVGEISAGKIVFLVGIGTALAYYFK